MPLSQSPEEGRDEFWNDVQKAITASLESRFDDRETRFEDSESRFEDNIGAAATGFNDDNPTRLAYLEARRAENGEGDTTTEHVFDADRFHLEASRTDVGAALKPPRRRNIDDCIAELENNSYNTLPRRSVHGADTAVFIDPPAKEPSHSDYQYREICAYYKEPFYIQSLRIAETNSEKLLAELGPTAQFRIKRRRASQVARIQATFPHITKFLDLTPKVEGQDAVQMVMNLSCPLGVRLWGLAAMRFGVAKTMVGGIDEFSLLDTVDPSDAKSPRTSSSPTVPQSEYQTPPEYSSIRHRACLQRVLLAIEGLDPCLDSAPKVYNTAILAKSLGIMQSPLTDYVVRWLRAAPNSVFLEILPEVALTIAECLQCGDVARDAFAILVGESVLEMQVEQTGGAFVTRDKDRTVHHRRKEALSEEWENRIQYARLSFFDQVRSLFSSLVEEDMVWVEELLEYRKLQSYKDLKLKQVEDFCRALKEFVRSLLYRYISGVYLTMNEREILRNETAANLFPTTGLKETWQNLRPVQRFFTRSFWEIICRAPLDDIPRDRDTSLRMPIGHFMYGNYEESTSTQLYRSCELIKPTTMKDLRKLRLDAYYSIKHSKPRQENTHTVTRSKVTFEDTNAPSPAQSNLPIRPASNRVSWKDEPRTSSSATTSYDTYSEAASTETLAPPTYEEATTFSLLQEPRQENSNTSQDSTISTRKGISDPMNPGYLFQTPHHGSTTLRIQQTPDTTTQLMIFFKFDPFFQQVSNHLTMKAQQLLSWPEDTASHEDSELLVTNVLISLSESETKYLPLWAGGLDDGSGGIFGGDIPLADNGFAPGRGVRGIDSTRGSSNSSSFSDVGNESTAGATSAVVHDGYGDTLNRKRVYSTSEVPSSDESSDWNLIYEHKNLQDKGPTKAYMSEVGEATMVEDDSDFDIVTPTGNENRHPDLNEASAALVNAQDLEHERVIAENEQREFEDMFMHDSDSDLDDFDNGSLTGEGSNDEVMDHDFVEMESYRGFDGQSVGLNNRVDQFVEDRGENYGTTFGKGGPTSSKGKEKVVPGSVANMERAYNPTYVYKDGPEDESMDDRP